MTKEELTFRFNQWGMKYCDIEFNPDLISQQAIDKLSIVVDEFPNQNYKVIGIEGNIVQGNCLFNILVSELIENNKINTRALRISCIKDFNLLKSFTDIDIVLLDYVDFGLFTDDQKREFIYLLDTLSMRTKLIIINISYKESIKLAPVIIKNFLEYNTLMISLRK
jgi:hypothetical protein